MKSEDKGDNTNSKIAPPLEHFPVASGITKEQMIEIRKLYNQFSFDEAKQHIEALQLEQKQKESENDEEQKVNLEKV